MASEDSKLSKFTDFFNYDLPNSQPISLPSSSNSQEDVENNIALECERIRPPKGYGQKGQFRCVEEVDSKYRGVFTYQYFNLVQSKLIDDALYSAKSMVVCAPTGSGKTVVFEMAIVQLLTEIEEKNYTDDYKIIYMAPVKALCSERLAEWYPKFMRLGLLCIEVTGDTDVDFPQLKPYRIIITTPEKWDMLTRRWKDHRALVEMVKLFLIDEVHILNDEVRGPVLEAVVSRMKTVEASAQSSHRIEQLQRQREGVTTNTPPPRIRFVAVSATVSNPDDVATWLGTRDRPAVFYKFGDECRPVRLRRVVEGYPCPAGASIFKFDIILNYKIWPIIQRYHNGKPTLIFCNTRKSVLLTAETLSKELTVSFSQTQKAKLMEIASTIKTKKIQSLILFGVGCHHAGLLYEERQTIEDAFRNRKLPILITTTTLAMGVNLPAHLVIIKNTQQYVNGTYQEYSISTILQMVGRAGRPQFDTEATAVIMTRLSEKARYEALVGGCEPLQSYLHKRIAENLNSEAALSTVCDVAQCVQWLNSTFFSVRAARDPKRYLGLPYSAPQHQISKKIEELCVKAMNGLATAGLITMDEASCIESTEAGRLMSVYYLDLETMKLIMKIEGSESLEQLLWLVCESHELSEMHLRVDERRNLNLLNRNKAAPTIRFPMKGKIITRQMKSNCVIQAILGCLPIPDPSLNQEATKIIRIAERVCKCLVAYMTRPDIQKTRYFSAVVNSLILCKCVCAHLWENSPYMSKQLRGIGPTLSGLLATAGKVNFTLIEESHPRDLERIINKAPPAGNMLRKQVSLLPKYSLKLLPLDSSAVRVQLMLLNAAFLAENLDHLTAGAHHKCYLTVGDSENYILYFSTFKDSDLVSVYDGCITFEITRLHNHEHKIMVHCISSNFVGLDERCEHTFDSLLPAVDNDNEITALNEDYKEHEGAIAKNYKRRLNDVGQCNEKKKRGNNFIESLQNLKKSFLNSTNDIKTQLNRTKDLSEAVLQGILEPGEDICDDNELTLMMCNPENDVVFTNPSYDINDEEIGYILNDIESEINNHSENSNLLHKQNKDFEQKLQNAKEDASNKITRSCNKKATTFKNKRSLNTRNNFSFLDNVETQLKQPSKELEGSLPDLVKEQILQFLGKAKDETIKKDCNVVDIPSPEDNESNGRPRSSKQNDGSKYYFTNEEMREYNKIIHANINTTDKIRVKDLGSSSNTLNFTTDGKDIVKVCVKNDELNVNSEEENSRGEINNDFKKTNEHKITETADEINKNETEQDNITSIVSKDMRNNSRSVATIKPFLLHNTITTGEENCTKIENRKNVECTNENNNDVAILNTKQSITQHVIAKHSHDSVATYPNATNENSLEMAGVKHDGQLSGATDTSCERFKIQEIVSRQNDECSNKLGSCSNKNKIIFARNPKDHGDEQNNSAKHIEREEYVNKFSYTASKINVITKKDSQLRIVNKLAIDLKVTQIVCKEFNTNVKNQEKDNLETNNQNYDDISTESGSSNKIVKYDLKGTRNSKQNKLNYPLNTEIKDVKSLTTIGLPNVQNVDKDTAKEEKGSFKNIIEKFRTRTRSEAQKKLQYLPKINKTVTPIVKSQKQYRIKDINNTDDSTMKNVSQIFCEGKHDFKKHNMNESLSAIDSLPIDSNKLTPNLDTLRNIDSFELNSNLNTETNNHNTKSKPDSATWPSNQNIPDTKNSMSSNHIEDNVFDALKYQDFKIDHDSPLEPEDIMSVLTESESEEINLSMLNPKTLLQSLTEDVEVIPPPIEFCDDVYSPVNPITTELSSYTPPSPHNEIGYSEPTASNVKTWTLSQERDGYDYLEPNFTDLNSFSMFTNQNFYSPCSQINLSQFKYESKPKFRK